MYSILCVIPARYASTRFPGKPLVDIHGKTMIQRVYEQTCLSLAGENVYIATDDERIYNHVIAFGGKVVMTSPLHRTGTERCLEAYHIIAGNLNRSFDVVINVQGDEPFISPLQVNLLASCFKNPAVRIATLITPITNALFLHDPNVVKVVVNQMNEALYFSRAAIPFMREAKADQWVNKHCYYKHIGLYAWQPEVLEKICSLTPTPLESSEKLEQLRWLENGYQIHTQITEYEPIAIDTPEDLLKLTNIS